MIGIGKPSQFGRDAHAAPGNGDFVGFSGFGGSQKAKNARAAGHSQRAPCGGCR
jgi:hypothetical protein